MTLGDFGPFLPQTNLIRATRCRASTSQKHLLVFLTDDSNPDNTSPWSFIVRIRPAAAASCRPVAEATSRSAADLEIQGGGRSTYWIVEEALQ
jgi:hypothetical protein